MSFLTLKSTIVCLIALLLLNSCEPQQTNKLSDEECRKNSSKNILVLDLEEDKYHCDYEIEKLLKQGCFKIINKHLPNFKKLNLEQAIELSNTMQIDFIVYGFVSVRYIDKNEYISSLGQQGRQYAKQESGTWACATLFRYNTKTKETIEVMNDEKIKKVGGE